jgi:hypothetical protein
MFAHQQDNRKRYRGSKATKRYGNERQDPGAA